MEETYAQRYGIRGSVLYPSRSSTDVIFDAPCDKPTSSFPTFAYAGSINSRGYAKCISDLACALETLSGRVLLFTPHSKQELASLGLDKPCIVAKPIIPQRELTTKLREEADVLFVPMTFEEWFRENMIAGFPSKLTDYTAAGRPILIWGPKYCSAVRWALENPGVAEIVQEDNTEMLKASVEKLVSNSAYRRELGRKALIVGQDYFSHASVTQKFYGLVTANG